MTHARTPLAILTLSSLGLLVTLGLSACGSDDDPIVGHPSTVGGAGSQGTGGGAATAGSSNGGSTVGTNPCGEVDPALAEASASKLFVDTEVPTFDFYLPEADWEHLKATARDEVYTQAQACFNGRAVGVVGLRFKGSYGSLFNCFDAAGNNTCRKLGMKVKFDEFVDGQHFYGLKRLNFQGYRYDGSYLKERLAYDLYADMGISAPRATWAKLRVNGEEQGLFGMVEQIDGKFAADRWPSAGDNNLYKELWPGETDQASVTSKLETNKTTADIKNWLDFATTLAAAKETELRSTLGKYVDLDYLATYMAVDDAIANFDGVTTFYTNGNPEESGNHNFFFYEQSPTNYTIIPWDLESTMSLASQFGNVPEWQVTPSDCSVIYGVWNGQGQVTAAGCNPVFQALAQDLTAYRDAAQRLLDGPFAIDAMTAKIDRLASLIRADAAADPKGIGATEFEKEVGFIKLQLPNLRRRLEHLMSGAPTLPLTFDASGLVDFEKSDAYGLYAGTSMLSNPNTQVSVEVNRQTPISGSQTLRIAFGFRNETAPYQQWMFYAVPLVKSPSDVTKMTGIRLKVRSNVARSLRLNLDSVNNSASNQGIKKGWDIPVTTTATEVTVKFADAKVQPWATDPGDDLAKVLATVSGLGFEPQCAGRNSLGQLPEGVTDQGWVDIDDLEFF